MPSPKLKRTHVAWTVFWLILAVGIIANRFLFGEQAFYWALSALSLPGDEPGGRDAAWRARAAADDAPPPPP